jgi:hypothetical protein
MEAVTVRKRFGKEEWDVRQFVQPDTPGVVAIARSFSSLPKDKFIEAAWGWVVNNIKYPPGNLETADRHYLEAFTGKARRRYVTFDYWSFPAETLTTGYGDCEDVSFLLASILRSRLSEDEVFVTIGTFRDFGHAWVTLGDGLVLEATSTPEAPRKYVAVKEAGSPYRPMLRFNDKKVTPLAQGFWVKGSRRKLSVIKTYFGG